jgi:hypothetical protein
MPEVMAPNLIDSKFYSDLGKFHNDRFPYRGWLIKGKNWIDYFIFDTTPSSSKVHIGEDGWLFYTPSLDDYLKDSCQDRELIRNLAKKLKELEEVLEESGRRLIFVVAPNKASIYPEHVGYQLSENRCGKSRYDLLLEAPEDFPVKGFVRVDHLLVEEKSGHLVYEKNGTHWNIYGAKIASEAILSKISTSWRDLLPHIEISMQKKSTALSEMLTMFAPITDERGYFATSVVHKSTVSVEEKTPLENGRPRLKIVATSKRNEKLLPKTVMYRDSFMILPLTLLKGSFEQIDALWIQNIPSKIAVETDQLRKAEIVFIEVVERNLSLLNIDVNKLPSLDPLP